MIGGEEIACGCGANLSPIEIRAGRRVERCAIAGSGVKILEKTGPMFGGAEDISIPDASINDHHPATQFGRRVNWNKWATLCSRPNPIIVRDKIVVDWIGWQNLIGAPKFKRETKDLSRCFSMIVDMDMESTGKPRLLNGMSHGSSNKFGDKLSHSAARNVSPLDLMGVGQLVFVNSPNHSSEASNVDCSDGRNKAGNKYSIRKRFSDLSEDEQTNVFRDAIILLTAYGLIAYFDMNPRDHQQPDYEKKKGYYGPKDRRS
jgi:hypothetical protein